MRGHYSLRIIPTSGCPSSDEIRQSFYKLISGACNQRRCVRTNGRDDPMGMIASHSSRRQVDTGVGQTPMLSNRWHTCPDVRSP
jgi:hypothetical protein